MKNENLGDFSALHAGGTITVNEYVLFEEREGHQQKYVQHIVGALCLQADSEQTFAHFRELQFHPCRTLKRHGGDVCCLYRSPMSLRVLLQQLVM